MNLLRYPFALALALAVLLVAELVFVYWAVAEAAAKATNLAV